MNVPPLSVGWFWEGHGGDLGMCSRVGVPGCQGQGPGLEFVGDDRGPLCFSPVSRWSAVAVGPLRTEPQGPGRGSPCRDCGGSSAPHSGHWGEADAEDRMQSDPSQHFGSLCALGAWLRGNVLQLWLILTTLLQVRTCGCLGNRFPFLGVNIPELGKARHQPFIILSLQ